MPSIPDPFQMTTKMLLSGMLLLVIGCAATKKQEIPCHENIPRTVKGLVIKGPRPADNVIVNMTAIICNWRAQATSQGRTDLKGNLTLRLRVDHVGEIGVLDYHHTMPDSAYVERLVQSLYLLDFDPWNDQPDETEIEYPVVLFE